MTQRSARVSVVNEFSRAELGDRRLHERLAGIVATLERRPDAGFPQLLQSEAELEGFYRFVRNGRVSLSKLLDPHVEATFGRCVDLAADGRPVLAVHDTTEFRFGGEVEREGLGRLQQSGHGFFGHFTLAVTPGEHRQALGILRVKPWSRTGVCTASLVRQKKLKYSETHDLPKEQERWAEGVRDVDKYARDVLSLIHVMDSEADDYALISELVGAGSRFVIRLCQDRLVGEDKASAQRISQALEGASFAAERTVRLARRTRHPGGNRRRQIARDEREARLSISAVSLTFRRPHQAKRGLVESVSVNVVRVVEENTPEGCVPVEWQLATTEPIATVQQVLAVVDHYRARWMIEEYFKALKTGCAFEKRQLESAKTLQAALGLFVPIAWGLLRLRTTARVTPDAPATNLATPTELLVLRAATRGKLAVNATAREVMLAIAGLGGHIKNNGDPGWQVLGRGYVHLRMLVEGFELARSDQS